MALRIFALLTVSFFLFAPGCKEPVTEEAPPEPVPAEQVVETPPVPEVTEAEINQMAAEAKAMADAQVTAANMEQTAADLEKEIDQDME